MRNETKIMTAQANIDQLDSEVKIIAELKADDSHAEQAHAAVAGKVDEAMDQSKHTIE